MRKGMQIWGIVLSILTGIYAMFSMAHAQASTVQPTNESINGIEIHFLDVGQADAAILICDGQIMMIDGGNAQDSSFIYSYLVNTLQLDHIDYMIATHPHEDHIGGLSGALNACTVGCLYSPVTEYDSREFESLVKYAGKQEIAITVPQVGDTFSLGSATAEFLAPIRMYSNTNDLSLVVRITYGDTSFLFTGDAETDAEHDIIDAGLYLDSTLLKVPHHGSDTSSTYVFLREVMPEYAVISVGADNSYGHPTDAVLSRLRDAGTQVFRTDLHGTIICTSDGKTLNFVTEKEGIETSTFAEPMQEPTTSSESNSDDTEYVGNKNSKKFHYAWCSSVDDMKPSNKVPLSSKDEAISSGYVPCKRCNP